MSRLPPSVGACPVAVALSSILFGGVPSIIACICAYISGSTLIRCLESGALTPSKLAVEDLSVRATLCSLEGCSLEGGMCS